MRVQRCDVAMDVARRGKRDQRWQVTNLRPPLPVWFWSRQKIKITGPDKGKNAVPFHRQDTWSIVERSSPQNQPPAALSPLPCRLLSSLLWRKNQLTVTSWVSSVRCSPALAFAAWCSPAQCHQGRSPLIVASNKTKCKGVTNYGLVLVKVLSEEANTAHRTQRRSSPPRPPSTKRATKWRRTNPKLYANAAQDIMHLFSSMSLRIQCLIRSAVAVQRSC